MRQIGLSCSLDHISVSMDFVWKVQRSKTIQLQLNRNLFKWFDPFWSSYFEINVKFNQFSNWNSFYLILSSHCYAIKSFNPYRKILQSKVKKSEWKVSKTEWFNQKVNFSVKKTSQNKSIYLLTNRSMSLTFFSFPRLAKPNERMNHISGEESRLLALNICSTFN